MDTYCTEVGRYVSSEADENTLHRKRQMDTYCTEVGMQVSSEVTNTHH